jgi:hypothetical protein
MASPQFLELNLVTTYSKSDHSHASLGPMVKRFKLTVTVLEEYFQDLIAWRVIPRSFIVLDSSQAHSSRFSLE